MLVAAPEVRVFNARAIAPTSSPHFGPRVKAATGATV